MAARVLNMEIGDRISKVCQTVRRGKAYQIEKCFLFGTPDGAVSDGFINDPAALAEVIRAELAKNGLGGIDEVIFSVSSGRIATREVTLPPVKDNRIQSLVETNAADYFPVDMSNYQVTYTLLERKSGDEPGLRVLVMAAPIALIQTYIALSDACGMHIQNIDYSGNSQFQALRTLQHEGVTAYVNVDCGNTYCSFISNGDLLLQRTFAFGGAELVNAYLSSTGRGKEDFLTVLRELQKPDFQGITQEEVGELLERLISSIVRGCDYFFSAQGTPVEQIVLMGPCGHMVHICKLIAAASGVDTIYLEEAPGIEKLANSVEDASFYISCIGASVTPVDLLPAEYRSRKKRSGRREKGKEDDLTGGVVICVVCVAASIILCAISVLGYVNEQKHYQQMQDRVAELSYVQQVYDTYITYTANQEGLQVVQDTARGQNAELKAFFEELERKMPTGILLLTASCDSEGVTMDVTVNTYEEAAVTINQLRGFDSIDVIQVSEVAREKNDAGVARASFSVSCLYPKPEAPAPAADGTAAEAGTDQGETAGTEG